MDAKTPEHTTVHLSLSNPTATVAELSTSTQTGIYEVGSWRVFIEPANGRLFCARPHIKTMAPALFGVRIARMLAYRITSPRQKTTTSFCRTFSKELYGLAGNGLSRESRVVKRGRCQTLCHASVLAL